MNILPVKEMNIDLLKNFIENIGEASKSFRYYNHRSVDVIKKHLITLLLLEDNTPIAYGHLEPENHTIWLGICVLPQYYGRGYGSKMMTVLIEEARKSCLNLITLLVDRDNLCAINLYKKFGFERIGVYENHYKYILKIHG